MLATVSSSADQYHHTTNTLKYADRAKEIKTHIQVHICLYKLSCLYTKDLCVKIERVSSPVYRLPCAKKVWGTEEGACALKKMAYVLVKLGAVYCFCIKYIEVASPLYSGNVSQTVAI
jgi:hypothetical protein